MSKRIVDFVGGAVNDANVFTPDSVRTGRVRDVEQFDTLSPLARLDHSLEEGLVDKTDEGQEEIVNDGEKVNETEDVQQKLIGRLEEANGFEIFFRAMKRKRDQDIILKNTANVLRKIAGENGWKVEDFMVLIVEETLNGEI